MATRQSQRKPFHTLNSPAWRNAAAAAPGTHLLKLNPPAVLVVDVVPAADGAADGDTDCCGDVDVCLLDAGAGAAGGVESISILTGQGSLDVGRCIRTRQSISRACLRRWAVERNPNCERWDELRYAVLGKSSDLIRAGAVVR